MSLQCAIVKSKLGINTFFSMQRQRQQLHERQAAAYEQLRAVALVKVRVAFLNTGSMFC